MTAVQERAIKVLRPNSPLSLDKHPSDAELTPRSNVLRCDCRQSQDSPKTLTRNLLGGGRHIDHRVASEVEENIATSRARNLFRSI
jgi:hypothetical protein